MTYNKFMKGYKAHVNIREGQIFKFIVDDQYLISKYYDTTFVMFLSNLRMEWAMKTIFSV